MVLGIGKLWKRWRWYRKLAPFLTIIENLYRSGELKSLLGGRKFRMTLIAQVLGTTTAVVMAQLGLPETLIETVLNTVVTMFGVGVAGNLYEHTAKTVQAVKAAKATEVVPPE